MAAEVPNGSLTAPAISPTNGADDAAMSEPDGIEDVGRQGSVGYDVQGQVETDSGSDPLHSEPETGDPMDCKPPQPHGTRTHGLGQHSASGKDASTEDEAPGYDSKVGGVSTAALAALAALTDEMLFKRLEKMITTNQNGPVASGERGIGMPVLINTCVRVKAAVNSLYDKHGGRVCRSPERPDLQLSQEEAYGRFIVDLVIGVTELVPHELREIGKRRNLLISLHSKSFCPTYACTTPRERWREPHFARVPLTLAHLLLFHRRLDGCSHTTRAPAPVKIRWRCESEQTLSVQRYMRAGSIVNAIT